MNVSQAVHSHAKALLANVQPLRAIFEDLVVQVRFAQPAAGMTNAAVTAALVLRYQGHNDELTVPIALDAESGAVCVSDPLPLGRAGLVSVEDALELSRGVLGDGGDPEDDVALGVDDDVAQTAQIAKVLDVVR